jgi:peptidoglycan/LPS O-acetylase OafA/YrhL
MGIFRFILAALVVLFHFGGLSWIVGRVAVFAFYCISGYLIFQVLDRVYFEERGATRRFLVNRLLRIGPLYVTYVVLTAALIAWAGRDALITDQGRPVLAEGELEDLFVASLTFKRDISLDEGVPLLYFDAPLLPQGWSIAIEVTFYLLAPLVVFTTRARPWLLAVWIAAGLAVCLGALRASGVDFDRFQVLVYKNAAASWFVFFVGGAAYYVRRRWGQPLPLAFVALLAAVWLPLIGVPFLMFGRVPPSAAAFAQYLWVTLVVTTAVMWMKPVPLRKLDTAAGNLSYGVYLNHFLMAALLAGPFAVPYVPPPGTMAFGLLVLTAAAAGAWITYQLVEQPFDRVRARVRRAAIPQQAPAPWRVPIPAAAAVAVCLVLAGRPVAWAVDHFSGAASGAVLPLSPPFDVRWVPEVPEQQRQTLVEELGLVELEQVMRDPRQRTWRYQLRQPTPERVRALITHPAVEDTGGVDRDRFVIPQ